jgi:regulator of protease activity HflC (stomatin/prohibitin superfamily)
MIFFVFFLIAIFVAITLIRMKLPKIREEATAGGSWMATRTFWKCLTLPILILLFAIINPFKIERVDAGHVGIKVNLTGDNRGVGKYEYKTGWVIYNSWFSNLYEFPTYQQHIDYDEQIVITKGGFSATIKPSFNYSLKPGDVGDMFQSLRLSVKQIEQQWLHTAIVGTVNDVANRWTVDSIFNNREDFENSIVAEANRRVVKWFTVSQLRTNIIPPEAIRKSIEAKTQALQEVQVAENQKLVAQAEALRKIAQAKGDSAQAVIQAAGESEAIRRRQLVLTPNYIEFLKVTKWNGVLPQVQSGNAGILMNLGKP